MKNNRIYRFLKMVVSAIVTALILPLSMKILIVILDEEQTKELGFKAAFDFDRAFIFVLFWIGILLIIHFIFIRNTNFSFVRHINSYLSFVVLSIIFTHIFTYEGLKSPDRMLYFLIFYSSIYIVYYTVYYLLKRLTRKSPKGLLA